MTGRSPVVPPDGASSRSPFDPIRALPLLLAVVAVALGLFARLKGIGRWPVSYDEFFMGVSVRNILDHGVPRLAEGGYYVRGLLVQYAAAGARLAGFGEESAIRLTPLLCNLSVLPALWMLGRKLGGRAVAAVAVAFFALSAWEIEFARFGRMYAPIQAVTLWFAFLLHGVVAEGREGWRKWLAALVALSILVHESSIFLALALFLPDLLPGRRPKALPILLSLALLAAAVGWNAGNFRNYKVAKPKTATAGVAKIVKRASRKVTLPAPLFKTLPDHPWGALPVGAATAVSLGFLIPAFRKKGGVPPGMPRAALAGTALLSALHAFPAIPLFWAMAAMNGGLDVSPRMGRRLVLPALAIAAAFFAGWAVYASALVSAPGTTRMGSPLSWLRHTLFGWPDIAGRIVPVWMSVLPRLLILSLIVTAAAIPLWRRWPAGRVRGLQVTGTFFIFLLVLSAVVRTPYISTRYSFPLLPFLFLFAACGLAAISRAVMKDVRGRALLLVALAASFMFVSEDVRADRLLRPDSPRTNFREDDTPSETHHYIPRVDYRTPARFVDASRRPGDRVVLALLPPAFYLSRPADGFFIRRNSPEYKNHFNAATRRERWTGVPVLSDAGELGVALSAPGTTWVIAGSADFPTNRNLHRSLSQALGSGPVFAGVDGKVVVYRIGGGAGATRLPEGRGALPIPPAPGRTSRESHGGD
jgi:hypothetical protein